MAIDLSFYEETLAEGFADSLITVSDEDLAAYRTRAEQLKTDLETVTEEEYPNKVSLGCQVGCMLGYIICLQEHRNDGPHGSILCQAQYNNCINACNS